MSANVTVLWGRKPEYPSWQEDIITEKAEHVEAAREWAKTQGYTEFRVSVVDNGQPDFVAAIAIE